jgi:hypothetical protein
MDDAAVYKVLAISPASALLAAQTLFRKPAGELA